VAQNTSRHAASDHTLFILGSLVGPDSSCQSDLCWKRTQNHARGELQQTSVSIRLLGNEQLTGRSGETAVPQSRADGSGRRQERLRCGIN